VLFSETKPIMLYADSAFVCCKESLSKFFSYGEKDHLFLHVSLSLDTNQLAEKFYYFASVKELKIQKAQIKETTISNELGYFLTIESDKPVKNYHLKGDAPGYFSDNFFDMLPRKQYKIQFYNK